MIALSSSSPATRIDSETTIPPSEMTATSDVPPPMSTIIEPVGSPTGKPAPIAAAIRSSIREASRAPAATHASSDARVGEGALMNLLDDVSEHLLGPIEVGDHAVLERADRGDRAGGTAEHPLGLDADCVDLVRPRIDRDDAGLGQDDAAATHVDERVGGAEVDREIAAAETCHVAEETHSGGTEARAGAPLSGPPH